MPKSYNQNNQHNAKPDSDRASARIIMRVKESDKKLLEERAKWAGLTLSRYILSKVLVE